MEKAGMKDDRLDTDISALWGFTFLYLNVQLLNF